MPAGTTLIAMTGATLGQFSRLEIEAAGTQNVIGILSSDLISSEYIYESISLGMSRIVAAGTGGAQQHINKAVADNFQILYPGLKLMSKFSEAVKPLFDEISNLSFQNIKVAQIRDSLLPRLISGELQIPEEMLAS
jgi:type I restriction enzyme S subunit